MIGSNLAASVISGAVLRIASMPWEPSELALAVLAADGLTNGLIDGLTKGLIDGLTDGLAATMLAGLTEGLAEGLAATVELGELAAAEPVGLGVAAARGFVSAGFVAIGWGRRLGGLGT